MKVGVLTFPGTNCDVDLITVLEKEYNVKVDRLWHTQSFKVEHDIYFIPGGFSYGDYLRSGILAKASTSVQSLHEATNKGCVIVGICNGFQILTETYLLPGALISNSSLKHICKWVECLTPSRFLHKEGLSSHKSQEIALPVSHSSGNYICEEGTLKDLQDNDRIILQYKDDVNGSMERIAGIRDSKAKVFGMMPHPERAFYSILDNEYSNKQYGKLIFDSIFSYI